MDQQFLSIHRWDVLLPVTFKGHRPSTNHNSIVQLRIRLPRRDLLLEQASLYQTSSPVFTVFVFQSVSSSKSPTEQWMAVIQCTCRPTFTPVADVPARMRLRSSTSDQLIVSSYNLATVGRRAFLESPPPISGTVFLYMSHQHRRSRFSGLISRVFSSGAPLT